MEKKEKEKKRKNEQCLKLKYISEPFRILFGLEGLFLCKESFFIIKEDQGTKRKLILSQRTSKSFHFGGKKVFQVHFH